ncbi:ABC transporter substrate-binding protein [Bordetella genomosp. 4]|uniref:ABC transporter substrate-binding protein n=1 Tax=Bordetella genomosp. 4 TaxID=463044 RepID=UPI00159512DB|nr:ABC transporter substrate-binding protein [Bordetella genomosp. 4]
MNKAIALVALSLATHMAAPHAASLKIGAINPYSGPLALYGDELARGYQLAIEEINAEGGLLGKSVELLRGDAQTPQQGIAAVEKLATQDNVDLFIGTYSSAVANSASDAAMRFDKLYWDTNALGEDLTERNLPNYIRSGPNALTFADVSVEAIRDVVAPSLGKPLSDIKVWIEHEDSIFGTSIAKRQQELLTQAGAKVVGTGKHNFRAIDLNDAILRAKRANPDIWINTGYVPDTNLLLRSARTQGFKPGARITVATGDTKETLEALGKEGLEGAYVISYPHPQMSATYAPGAKDYLQKYRAKYGTDPVAPQSMTAYTGMKILADVLKKAQSTSPGPVRAAAASMNLPVSSTATGYGVKFSDKMQNELARPTMVQWQNGSLTTAYPIAAREAGGDNAAPRAK